MTVFYRFNYFHMQVANYIETFIWKLCSYGYSESV